MWIEALMVICQYKGKINEGEELVFSQKDPGKLGRTLYIYICRNKKRWPG